MMNSTYDHESIKKFLKSDRGELFLKGLTSYQRIVMKLRFITGYSEDEIAWLNNTTAKKINSIITKVMDKE